MNSIKDIGKIIRERRKSLKLEIEDLKDYSDITCSTISNIENGKANPTIKTLQKILDPLGLEININIKER
jgi:transcriptional regulator with XRE-family HTH domain